MGQPVDNKQIECPRCGQITAKKELCVDCLNQIIKTWGLANASYHRIYYLRHHYKLEIEAYALLVYDQKGKCKICKGPLTKVGGCRWRKKQCLGLICQRCNTALGYLGNSLTIVNRASRYLAGRLQDRHS